MSDPVNAAPPAGTPAALRAATVLHRSIPGPRSADPRDRQLYRRILGLAALGLEVTLVAVEVLPEGGAPRSLASAGIHLDSWQREPVRRRLARLAEADAALVVTSLLLPHPHRRAVLDWPGPVVVDLAELPSRQRRLGRQVFRAEEQPGIDTEIEHLETIEALLLERASVVLLGDEGLAGDLPGGTAWAIAPHSTVDPAGPAADGHDPGHRARPRAVAPARFSDEWATPDECAVAGLAQLLGAAGLDPGEVRVAAEDAVPRLRQTARGTPLTSLEGSAWAQSNSEVALDLRRHGCPTATRRRELSAAGVPWVATTTALGLTDPDAAVERFGPPARHFVADSSAAQAAVVRELLADTDLRTAVAQAQATGMGLVDPGVARRRLADALALVGGLPPPLRDGERLQRLTDARQVEEYLEAPPGGTLAAADARIAALEAEMVPVRLLGREDAIDLQSTLDDDARYRVYARTHLDAGPAAAPVQTDASRAVRFSILVPTYETDPQLLEACIRSVVDQQHQNWVLCLLDDGSPRQGHLDVLQRWADAEPRIELRCNDWNQGIALATNDALAMATERARDDGLGEDDDHFVVLLDHDDVLRPDALAWVARYAAECPEYELWYSDEDKILPEGELGSPFFKPDWSPELLMGVNYVCHLLSVRAEVLEDVGGFRAGFDGAQDYDLVLRLVDRIAERGGRIGHIAKPLYSWRVLPGSTALDTTEKPAAHLAGHRALEHALDRHGELATVEDGEYDTTHRIRYGVDTSQLLTVAIPTRDRVDLLARCVQRLRATAAALPHELLVIDNDSTDPDTLAYLDHLVAEGHQVVRYPHEFSFARQVNLAALHARGDLLLVLNNDTWAHNADWLLRMMEHAQRPEVGLVGAKLVFPPGMRGDRPQHEGIVMGMAGLAYNVDLGGYRGLDQFVRNTSGVTAACVMLRPSVFLEVGGMEERLRVAYNDVDFGLRVGEWGYRVIYTPHAVLEHPESASRGDLHPTEDEEWLIDRWGPKGAVREPFISPHLEWLMPVFFRL